MVKDVEVSVGGEQYSIAVAEVSKVERAFLASKAPDELLDMIEEAQATDNPEDIDTSPTGKIMDYLVYVMTETTEFTESQLNALTLKQLFNIGTAVLNSVFDDYETNRERDRLRRVRVTKEAIEAIFCGEMAVVGGMPDDAKFENFNYDPSRNEFQFIFSSGEWDIVEENERIPTHEMYAVGRCLSESLASEP